jgi:hypothetical protein
MREHYTQFQSALSMLDRIYEGLDPGVDYEEGIAIHQQYKNGELSDDAAEILLGNTLKEIDREREAFEEATEIDTTDVCQE